MRRGMLAATVALVALMAPGAARAEVDWGRGLIVVTGAAPGDVRAPSPAMARVKAARRARDAARADLRAAAETLPRAGGAELDAAAAARLDRALDAVLELDVDYGSDGSVVVTSALPIDSIRTAIWGADRVPETEGPAAIVVDARKLGRLRPRVGYELAAGEVRYRGPVIFLPAPPAAEKDPRIGRPRLQTRAKDLKDGAITVAASEDELAAAARARALVVVLHRRAK